MVDRLLSPFSFVVLYWTSGYDREVIDPIAMNFLSMLFLTKQLYLYYKKCCRCIIQHANTYKILFLQKFLK
jgi:hypothetical protein